MTEWRMSKVMAPPRKLDQVNIQAVRRLVPELLIVEANGDRLCDLANFQRMSEAIPEVIRFDTRKELRLSL